MLRQKYETMNRVEKEKSKDVIKAFESQVVCRLTCSERLAMSCHMFSCSLIFIFRAFDCICRLLHVLDVLRHGLLHH
jgi:hypothetical protein